MAAYLVVVRNLHKVVYLHALVYDCCSHHCAVNTGIGTNLDIVLNDGNAYLRYLLIAILGWLKAKAIGANHAASMKNTAAADLTIVINNGVAVNLCVRTDLRISAYCDMRMQDTALAYLHAFGNGNKRPDVALLAYLCRRVNEGKVADAFTLRLHAFIYLQELRHCFASICHLDERGLYLLLRFEVLIDEHDAALCSVDVLLVLLVGKKTDAARLSLFYLGEVVDLGFGVTHDGAAYQPCYHLCCKFHVLSFI